MKRFITFVFAVVVGVAMLGLSVPTEAAKLRIGAHRAIMGSFEVVADKAGFWKKEGLDYTFTSFKQGKLMRNAIIQNNLDTGTTGFSPFSTAISRGAKVTAIGVTANICGTSHVIVAKNSKWKNLGQLKGKTFVTKKGTSVDFALKSYILPAYGLGVGDFTWLSTYTTERVANVASGKADVGIVGDPQYEIAAQKGMIRSIETYCKYDATRMMHVGNPQTIKSNRDLYVKYFRGWLKAHMLLKSNPTKYADIYFSALKEIGTKTKRSVIQNVVRRLKSAPYITGEVRAYLNDMNAKQVKLKWIKNPTNFFTKDTFDDSMLGEAAIQVGYR